MKSKGWSVRGSYGKLLTDRSLRTQTENLANLSTRKGASMDLCTFQKIGLKDLDTFRWLIVSTKPVHTYGLNLHDFLTTFLAASNVQIEGRCAALSRSVPWSAVLGLCGQNLGNAVIINPGSAFSWRFSHTCLGGRFPILAAHKVPKCRANDLPPTDKFRHAVATKPHQVCYQRCLLVKILRIPRLRGNPTPYKIEKPIRPS